jgi:hypothetical protein
MLEGGGIGVDRCERFGAKESTLQEFVAPRICKPQHRRSIVWETRWILDRFRHATWNA